MELHQLRCFAAAVEEGGFKRATSRLGLTQPALSYQIKQLESELGVLLFHRRPTGVTPTETGRLLYQYAQQILETARRAKHAVREAAGAVVGKFRIGTINSVGIYFLPEVLQRMKKKYPKSQPSVLYCSSQEVIDALLTDQVDVVINANPLPDPRLNQEILIEEPISVVCGTGHPLLGRERIDARELEGVEFVSLSLSNPTGQLVSDYLAELGVNVEQVVTTDNIETVKKMVESGLGVSLLPDMVLGNERTNGGDGGALHRIELTPRLTRSIVLVTWRRLEISPAVVAFVEELRAAAFNDPDDESNGRSARASKKR